MRGKVVAISQDGRYGQIAAEDGQRVSYWTSEVRNGPADIGQMVDYQMWEGQPVEIFISNSPRPPSGPPPRASQQPRTNQAAYARPQFHGGQLAQHGHAASQALPTGYWIQLFTSPSGRISRRQFWLHGVLPLFGASIVLGWIPIIGQILMLGFLWGGICIAFKRFHDVGYPGWYSLIYLVPMVAAGVLVGLGMFITSIIDLAWLLAEILWGIGFLIGLAQFIFVYVRIGQEGENRFGPDPLAVA